MIPDKMAYDRAITVFSPDGRLYQVEYARQAVERASPVIGVTFDSGVLLGAIKSVIPLMVPKGTEKLFKVDEHIGLGYCGLIADSRILVDLARIRAQINKITYDEPIEVETLVKEICDRKQQYTQYGGIRPFGVSFLIAGYDDGPKLYETDPSGTHRQWLAHAIGSKSSEIREFFIKKYREGMKAEAAKKLLSKALSIADKDIVPERVEMAIADESGFRILDESEVASILK